MARAMERAARLFKSNQYAKDILDEEGVARAAWPAAVGKIISAHTSPAKLVRNKLIVSVEDALWQRQLKALSSQIIERLQKLTGSHIIQELEFKIAILRREPQRAVIRSTAFDSRSAPDEAESISDPVLQKVYRLSRKRATA
jgi:predicted nucleic acid-binding Zn ribbon protein